MAFKHYTVVWCAAVALACTGAAAGTALGGEAASAMDGPALLGNPNAAATPLPKPASKPAAKADDDDSPGPALRPRDDEDQSKVSSEKLRADGPVGRMDSQRETRPAEAAVPPKPAAAKPAVAKPSAGEPRGAKVAPPGKEPRETAKSSQPLPKTAAAEKAAAPAEKSAADAKPQTPAAAETPAPLPELTKEMIAFRDRIRAVLTAYRRYPLNTRDHTPADVLRLCQAYGCNTEVQHAGQPLNGITCLCWNYPCAGYELLQTAAGRIAPRIGYAYQTEPGQLLAILALARVPADYPVRVGERVRTVADLIEYEKASCRAAGQQSWRLAGLAHYVPLAETWKNDRDDAWSVERLVSCELEQPVAGERFGGTPRLLGLGMAVNRWTKFKGPDTPVWSRVRKFVAEYQQHAFRVQHTDGSWHPSYFAAVGGTKDHMGHLQATGHVTRFLVVTLPEQRLDEARLLRAVDYLATFLGGQANRWYLSMQSPQSMDSITSALAALSLYDTRVFKPYDKQSEEEEKAGEQPQASQASQVRNPAAAAR